MPVRLQLKGRKKAASVTPAALFNSSFADSPHYPGTALWSTGLQPVISQLGYVLKINRTAAVECERPENKKTAIEGRYFISSLDGLDAKFMAEANRGHWGIENSLHWSLDVSFREDDIRVRKGHGAENLSRLRR